MNPTNIRILTSCSGSHNTGHWQCKDRHLCRFVREAGRYEAGVDRPIRAMPAQFGAASSVGGVLASPISWVW